MANIAVFASGNGSNFEILAKEFLNDPKNKIQILICNKKNAFVIERAKKLGIIFYIVNHLIDGKDEVENKIISIIKNNNIDIIFLAGYMKILSAKFISSSNVPIINIHPSLLPKYKGIDAIKKAYYSKDDETGITIHYINEIVDSGEIILQKSILLNRKDSLEEVEDQIHQLEHKWYPIVARNICENINKNLL